MSTDEEAMAMVCVTTDCCLYVVAKNAIVLLTPLYHHFFPSILNIAEAGAGLMEQDQDGCVFAKNVFKRAFKNLINDRSKGLKARHAETFTLA